MVLALLLIAALALITIDYRGGAQSPLAVLRDAGAAVFGPIERASAAVLRPIGNTVDAITDAPGQRRRAEELARENQRLREQLRATQLDASRAGELDKLLHSAGIGGYKVVPAQVVSAGQGLEDTVTIDVGSTSGVKSDMTVMTGDGLVGRVTRVGPVTATVLLASDAASSIGSRLEDSKEIGIAQGVGRRGLGSGGDTPIRFQLLDPDAPLGPGQRIVTLGSERSRPFVPGVPIGMVTRVERSAGALTRVAHVRPFVRFTSLDLVGVVVAPPRVDPRDAVLPPRPDPTPTPTPTPAATPTGTPTPGSSRRGGRRDGDGPGDPGGLEGPDGPPGDDPSGDPNVGPSEGPRGDPRDGPSSDPGREPDLRSTRGD